MATGIPRFTATCILTLALMPAFALGCPSKDQAVAELLHPTEGETAVDATEEHEPGANDGEKASRADVKDEEGKELVEGKPCNENRIACGESCVDLSTSKKHCGRCGGRCFSRQRCEEGVCRGLGVVGVNELKERLDDKDFLLVNVRVPPVGIIPGTDATIPHDRVDEIKELIGDDPDRKVVLYCGTAARVQTPVSALQESGYRSIAFVDGGAMAWRRAGLPMAN